MASSSADLDQILELNLLDIKTLEQQLAINYKEIEEEIKQNGSFEVEIDQYKRELAKASSKIEIFRAQCKFMERVKRPKNYKMQALLDKNEEIHKKIRNKFKDCYRNIFAAKKASRASEEVLKALEEKEEKIDNYYHRHLNKNVKEILEKHNTEIALLCFDIFENNPKNESLEKSSLGDLILSDFTEKTTSYPTSDENKQKAMLSLTSKIEQIDDLSTGIEELNQARLEHIHKLIDTAPNSNRPSDLENQTAFLEYLNQLPDNYTQNNLENIHLVIKTNDTICKAFEGIIHLLHTCNQSLEEQDITPSEEINKLLIKYQTQLHKLKAANLELKKRFKYATKVTFSDVVSVRPIPRSVVVDVTTDGTIEDRSLKRLIDAYRNCRTSLLEKDIRAIDRDYYLSHSSYSEPDLQTSCETPTSITRSEAAEMEAQKSVDRVVYGRNGGSFESERTYFKDGAEPLSDRSGIELSGEKVLQRETQKQYNNRQKRATKAPKDRAVIFHRSKSI